MTSFRLLLSLCLEVVEFTRETSTLRAYKLDEVGWVACALGWNTTVTTLDMTGIRLKS